MGLVPTDPQQPAGGTQREALLQDRDDQLLHQQRQAAAAFAPRQGGIADPVLQGSHPGNPGVQVGLELAGIQVPPSAALGMVVQGHGLAADRAGPAGVGPVLHFDVHRPCGMSSFTLLTNQGSLKPRIC